MKREGEVTCCYRLVVGSNVEEPESEVEEVEELEVEMRQVSSFP
jgi:hypothetical protein